MNNFAASLTTHISGLATISKVEDRQTPFAILHVADKNTAFHLIDIGGYKNFSTEQNCKYFFHDLSQKYERQGTQLVHVWEDIWLSKKEQVEARIAALLGHFTRYHARLTTVKKITNPTLIDFLQQHHLQIAIGGRYKYGLFFRDELLAVASFSAVRPMNRNGTMYSSHELLRFANKTGCVVAGGLSKLLAHFINEQNPDDVMTYVDCDWGKGKGYKMLGFYKAGELEPQSFLLDTTTNLRRHENSQAELSPLLRNDLNIYNSGSYKYIKDVKSQANSLYKLQ